MSDTLIKLLLIGGALVFFNVVLPYIRRVKEEQERVDEAERIEQYKAQNSKTMPRANTDSERKIGSYKVFEEAPKEKPWELIKEQMQKEAQAQRAFEKRENARKRNEEALLKRARADALRAAKMNTQNSAHTYQKMEGEICDTCYDEHSEENPCTDFLKDADSLKRAVVMAEVLGRPKALGQSNLFSSKF